MAAFILYLEKTEKTRVKTIRLAPFEQVDACKDAQEAKDYECRCESHYICCEWADYGTGKEGEVEDDGVPREVGGTVI